MSKNALTTKEKCFVAEYLKNGYNGSLAYQVAYKTSNRHTAKVGACNKLKLPRISDALAELDYDYVRMARENALDKKNILLELKSIIKGDNVSAKLRAINTVLRLTDAFSEHKRIHESVMDYDEDESINVAAMSMSEIDNLRMDILSKQPK